MAIRSLTDKFLQLFEMGLELSLARLTALAKFAFGLGLTQVYTDRYLVHCNHLISLVPLPQVLIIPFHVSSLPVKDVIHGK